MFVDPVDDFSGQGVLFRSVIPQNAKRNEANEVGEVFRRIRKLFAQPWLTGGLHKLCRGLYNFRL